MYLLRYNAPVPVPLQERAAHCKVRYDQVKGDGDKIHGLIEENRELFQVSTYLWLGYTVGLEFFAVENFASFEITRIVREL